MAEDVQISKILSYWLRHRPDAANLALDDAGWAPVDALLSALEREIPGISWERLLEVVELNDKRRFELSGDGEWIRALQGHSVDVTGDWPKTQPPEQLFHGTVGRFLSAILAEGLKPMRRHHVHLSPDAATAEKVGSRRGIPVVLTIKSSQMAGQGHIFRLTSNGVWLVDRVPPEFIELGR